MFVLLKSTPALTKSVSCSVNYRLFSTANARRFAERRIVPFTPEQLFDVVADVDRYNEFVPWCTASKVTARVDKHHMVADLSVGFRFLSESYSSVITLDRPRSVKVDVPTSSLFEYLINDWEFIPHPKGTELYFKVHFAFRSRLYQQMSNLFFEDVVKKMVSAFENRCHVLHQAKRERRRRSVSDAIDDTDDTTPGVMRRW